MVVTLAATAAVSQLDLRQSSALWNVATTHCEYWKRHRRLLVVINIQMKIERECLSVEDRPPANRIQRHASPPLGPTLGPPARSVPGSVTLVCTLSGFGSCNICLNDPPCTARGCIPWMKWTCRHCSCGETVPYLSQQGWRDEILRFLQLRPWPDDPDMWTWSVKNGINSRLYELC